MRITENAYFDSRSGRVRFSTWINQYLSSNTDQTAPYNLANDLAEFVPVKIAERNAFDKAAVTYVANNPNLAFRRIQERELELSDIDLVTMVSKNIIIFSSLLTLTQKKRYKAAGVRLPRVVISLNRDKLSEARFITISAMHDLRRTNSQERPLYSDYMYAKFMTQVLAQHMDVSGMSPKELWSYWLKFIDSYELT